jgi:hypothetical protein
VNPHTTEVVTQKVVERISRKEGKAVWDPVRLIGVVVKVGLGSLPQVANGLGSLVISSRPHAQRDTVESLGRILLQNEGVVDAVRLAATGANLNIVREACL